MEAAKKLLAENKKLKQWVEDLQSNRYINCVYCGHRYGPAKNTPVSMAEVLKQHIEQCPKHPMSKLKKQNELLLNTLQRAYRKHQKNDASIGWEELGDEMCDTLCEVMGDEEYLKFVKGL